MSKGKDLRISVAGTMLAGVVWMVGLMPSAVAAQDMDARWLPWLGCWEAVEGGDEAPLLCVRPATGGVEFVTWAEGGESSSEAILADGIQRNAEREECQGLETASFSADGHRVYLNSEYVCEGGVERGASGILAMINPMEWVDIKAVDGSPWVLRYRLARASRVQEMGMENVVASRASDVKRARIAASAPLTDDDLIEAVGKVDGAALEALIVERGDVFAVDADMLIRLDDAGVPAGVIDLVVAVSHPERFAVKAGAMPIEEYQEDVGYGPSRRIYMGMGIYDPFWGGSFFGYSPFSYGYGRYGGFGYYGGYGYGGYYPYYQPAPIVVTPRTSGNGRMIKGRGYTRGSTGSGYTGGTARPRGSSGSSGGGRATASPGVRSSGGSSSAGRTAKPRGGGSSGGSGSVSGSSSGTSKVRTAKPRGSGGLI